jgi:hypothetical protein
MSIASSIVFVFVISSILITSHIYCQTTTTVTIQTQYGPINGVDNGQGSQYWKGIITTNE